MYEDLEAGNAIGEIEGLYLDADGRPVQPDMYRRQGTDIIELAAVARGGDGRAAILVAGSHRRADGKAPDRARTMVAALRAHIASVFITDLAYAKAVLHEHARQQPPRTPDAATLKARRRPDRGASTRPERQQRREHRQQRHLA